MSCTHALAQIPIDLHSHSYYSDGVLSPAELVQTAYNNGTALLALTDHDCTDGLAEASDCAEQLHLPFVKGVEISVTWQNTQTLHIVGLGIDPTCPELMQGLKMVRSGRLMRLKKMHDLFIEHGIEGVYEGALHYAKNPLLVGRLHIARYLVQIGLFDATHHVFRYYLTPGKIGYVPHHWASLPDVMAWIRHAKGIPVLAHPSRYGLTAKPMTELLQTFYTLGGIAIEAGSARHSVAEIQHYVDYAKQFNLEVSVGSDFHAPSADGRRVGFSPALPSHAPCVWYRWLPAASSHRNHDDRIS